MHTSNVKTEKRERRHRRIRSKVQGTQDVPRLSVYKSNKFIYAQIINDDEGKTLAAISTKDMKGKGMMEKAKAAGIEIGNKAKALKIAKVVFDRGGFIYTGRIKALADGARESGLTF